MTSHPRKTIAIIGATGNQGFSVAETFSSLPGWHIRAITRSPSSDKAKELAQMGCEIVQADLADIPSLSRAFDGAHAIFLNTDFWATYRASALAGDDPEKSAKLGFETEIQHGKNAALAAAAVPTLERLVYSALGPMNAASGGKYPTSYHWETKALIVNYIEKEQPELAGKISFVYMGAYATNPLLSPKPDASTGEYRALLPCSGKTRMPICDETRSPGPFVRALVEDEAAGVKLLAYDSYLTMEEAVEAWSRVTGKSATVVALSIDEMSRRTGVPHEVLWAPAFVEEFGFMAGVEGFIEPAQLQKKVTTASYEEWLRTRDMNQLLSRDFTI
ncbi:NAD(P)-binding protein [Xylaria bambusicola]|uniref:NAD(P)-binding protein n=1 Tax=Xylaria bambusicola TaxID=326684 RepID=UPI002007D113|nr:NAD(P)-binding protein [Xylaria bambusicola]KAI0505464.1 NAD(P)-binding protein [Xylaria bambusicola]